MTQSFLGPDTATRPTLDSTRQRAHLTFRGNVKSGRHGWLRLTPAYSLHVVREILEECGPGDLVLDPFSGTGTTPLVAASLGIRAHSVDINPFLIWFGNLKLQTFSDETPAELQRVARRVVTGLRRRKQWQNAWTPNLHQIEKWWDLPILEGLAHLHASLTRRATKDQAVSKLLQVAFCRVMIGTSNASFSHQSMSFKKRDATRQPLLLHSTEDARSAIWSKFLQDVDEVAAGLLSEQPTAAGEVFLGDARDLTKVLPANTYTKVITSPPYPNRMSYIRELRPYMYWLGFLDNGRAAGELDWQAIGGTWGCATSNLSSWKPEGEAIPYPRFTAIVNAISEDHQLLGRYVHKYFEDIKSHLKSLKRVMAAGGECHYVVGNSKFYGTLLPVEEIYAALFKDSGFKRVRIDQLRKRNSKKELYEYVVSAET